MPHIEAAPRDEGRLELIVSRPASGERRVQERGRLDPVTGLDGDNWADRPSSRMPDDQPHPDMQLTLMSWRAVGALSPDADRRPLAGDQLYVDLDLSGENLPAGTRILLGDAEIEITAEPHRGCAKFRERFGVDAVRWVNGEAGRRLNLRGVNAKVVAGGEITTGDTLRVRR